MIRVLLGILVCLATVQVSSAAPAQLKGKSVVLSWTENRMQWREGESEFKPRTINMGLSVYVSSEGRVFNGMQSNSGANDQAPGESPKGGRIPGFEGRTMTIMQPLRGLARCIVVEFGGDFASCTASVITGKESGAGSGRIKAFGSGLQQEVQSVSTSGTTCAREERQRLPMIAMRDMTSWI
jgi:hypothetical protein